MKALLDIIAELGLELHSERIDIIAAKIASLGSVNQFALAKSSFGPNSDKQQISRFDAAWRMWGNVTPIEVAAALKSAAATAKLAESRGKVELVWTGPDTGLVPVRHTAQVLCELIESAKEKLFIVSYVAYDVVEITKALQSAVGRQVEVNILLERSAEHGGKVSVDSVQTMQAALPSANIYIWDSATSGAVHAKCAVADGKIAFVTSANLSNAAMDRNMELGIMVRGGSLPEDLQKQLESLVNMGIVERI